MQLEEENLTTALIQEVERHKLLWDPKHTEYDIKTKRRKAWVDVCRKIINDYDEIPEEMREKIIRATKNKWMAIQEMYCIERTVFEMNFDHEKSAFSPLERLLHFVRDIPPMINSWYHVNLEADTTPKKKKKEELTAESELQSNIDDSEALDKYLSNELNQLDEDWVFLSKILTLLKTLDKNKKIKFREQIINYIEKLGDNKGKY